MSAVSYKNSFICSRLSCHRRKSRQDRQRCALPGFGSGIDKILEHSELVLTPVKSYWGGKAASVGRHRFALQVSAPSLGSFLERSELREANGPGLLGFPGWIETWAGPLFLPHTAGLPCCLQCCTVQRRPEEDFPSPHVQNMPPAAMQFFGLIVECPVW